MTISRSRAFLLGVSAIGAVLLLQTINSFGCYKNDFYTFLSSIFILLSAPLLPAIVSLVFLNPLLAVGACALFAPWLVLAFYMDCIRPYSGGGASMIYIAVMLWGTLSAIMGTLVAGLVIRWLDIKVK